MTRAPQKRKLETRARLLAAARELSAVGGYEALRVEEVVLKAGVAKGTFFAHFADKDALLSALIGADLHQALDRMAEARPQTVEALAAAHAPFFEVAGRDRISFDITIRYSGAAAVTELNPITECFGRHMELVAGWFSTWNGPLRQDIDTELLTEGVQAFVVQTIALDFCLLHSTTSVADRFHTYLKAWLTPG